MIPGSKVAAFAMTPWEWIPLSWENAFSPTTGWTGEMAIPEYRETRREVSTSLFVSTPVETPRIDSRTITVWARSAFPARSPMPLTVTWTCEAPASTAAMVLATARPKSL